MKKQYIGIGGAIVSSVLTANSFGQASGKAVRPEDILSDNKNSIQLPNGTVARKGTIKATFDNIDLLDALFRGEAPGKARQEKIDGILEGVADLMPALSAVGLFRIFRASEWLQGNENPGRILVCLTYLETHLQQASPEEQSRLLARLQQITATFSYPEILSRAKAILKQAEKPSS
jgi:hypothetical protein